MKKGVVSACFRPVEEYKPLAESQVTRQNYQLLMNKPGKGVEVLAGPVDRKTGKYQDRESRTVDSDINNNINDDGDDESSTSYHQNTQPSS